MISAELFRFTTEYCKPEFDLRKAVSFKRKFYKLLQNFVGLSS